MRAEHARSAVEYILSDNQVDPVVDYLAECKGKEHKMSWKEITKKVFKVDDELSVKIFRKWMCGAVSRAQEPGSVMDWLMILVGAQGIGKSAFGRSLLPTSSWYGELAADCDTLIKEPSRMQMSFINELGEVDSMFCGRRADREKMKSLVSIREDVARLPYATNPERVPRAFVFYGNTNRSEFITDTESRRTFMIRVPDEETIDFKWVAKNRDALWGKAIKDYEDGLSRTWTRQEYESVHTTTMQYRIEDPIEQLLDEYLVSKDDVTIADIIRCVLQVPPHQQELKHSRRVSDLMTARAWTKFSTTRKVEGKSKSVRAFKRPTGTLAIPTLTDF